MTTRTGKKYNVKHSEAPTPNQDSTPSDISKLKRRPVTSDVALPDVPAPNTSDKALPDVPTPNTSGEVSPQNPCKTTHPEGDSHNISFTLIQIFFALCLLIVVLLSVNFVYDRLTNLDIGFEPHPIDPKFGECVTKLSQLYVNQDTLLWKQIVKNYNYNRSWKRTVLCQTLITPRVNKNSVECLVRKLSSCLGEDDPFVFKPSSDPIKSASLLERHLNYTTKEVGYFKEITDFTHPIPTVFHAICDPDHSPYKNKVFFFTIVTDSLTKQSKVYSRREISNYITDILNQNWVTRDNLFPTEQIAAVISRIADVTYYIKQEENISC